MDIAHAETDLTVLAGSERPNDLTGRRHMQPPKEADRERMAPGHLYNPRTGTGIEWAPAKPATGEPGRVRLWARQLNAKPTLIAEALHHAGSAWDYWYALGFAESFPQVTHWWFDDAWTGTVKLWQPGGVGRDPESGAPTLSGWMCYGRGSATGADDTPRLPWTVVLTSPPRVNIPLPPMSTSLVNLPLQLLLTERLMDMLVALTVHGDRSTNSGGITEAASDVEIVVTSLVGREDLHRAFPTHFGSWRLDRLPDLTPREALCRVQGLEPTPASEPVRAS